MRNEEYCKLKEEFGKFKAEYSSNETTEERKVELILLMQKNLKERCGKEDGVIMCHDGKSYSLSSTFVEDLYTIDGFLNGEFSKKIMKEKADIERRKAMGLNKYGPENKYPDNNK